MCFRLEKECECLLACVRRRVCFSVVEMCFFGCGEVFLDGEGVE